MAMKGRGESVGGYCIHVDPRVLDQSKMQQPRADFEL